MVLPGPTISQHASYNTVHKVVYKAMNIHRSTYPAQPGAGRRVFTRRARLRSGAPKAVLTRPSTMFCSPALLFFRLLGSPWRRPA